MSFKGNITFLLQAALFHFRFHLLALNLHCGVFCYCLCRIWSQSSSSQPFSVERQGKVTHLLLGCTFIFQLLRLCFEPLSVVQLLFVVPSVLLLSSCAACSHIVTAPAAAQWHFSCPISTEGFRFHRENRMVPSSAQSWHSGALQNDSANASFLLLQTQKKLNFQNLLL